MIRNEKIPWKRISVEAAAIVASILLAFSIDAWWDERQERARLVDTLVSLEGALSANLRAIVENIEGATANKEIVQAFIQMTPEEAGQIPVAERFRTLVALFRPGTINLNSSYIVDILNSRSLESLTDAALRDAMAQWRANLDDLNEVRFILTDRREEALQALARHEEVGNAYALDPLLRTDLSAEAMRSVRADRDILMLASLKAGRDRLHVRSLNSFRVGTETLLSLLRDTGYR